MVFGIEKQIVMMAAGRLEGTLQESGSILQCNGRLFKQRIDSCLYISIGLIYV